MSLSTILGHRSAMRHVHVFNCTYLITCMIANKNKMLYYYTVYIYYYCTCKGHIYANPYMSCLICVLAMYIHEVDIEAGIILYLIFFLQLFAPCPYGCTKNSSPFNEIGTILGWFTKTKNLSSRLRLWSMWCEEQLRFFPRHCRTFSFCFSIIE